jgi:hypothetical protein
VASQIPFSSYGPFLVPYTGITYKTLAKRYDLPDTPIGEYDGLTMIKMRGSLIMIASEDSRWMALRPSASSAWQKIPGKWRNDKKKIKKKSAARGKGKRKTFSRQ